jgi:Tfp pilus assembly protein PilF
MLAEKQKDLKNAEKYYEKAQNTEQGKKMASRHLARVAFKRGDLETARELLHHALVTYPRDAHSLHLLARIYLNSGDDPEMAEMLARQSASIAPENRDYLETLIQVLKMQGKTEEIEQARFKADNL